MQAVSVTLVHPVQQERKAFKDSLGLTVSADFTFISVLTITDYQSHAILTQAPMASMVSMAETALRARMVTLAHPLPKETRVLMVLMHKRVMLPIQPTLDPRDSLPSLA